MKYIELSKKIDDEILPIYIITGHDAFLISKTIAQFKKKCVVNYPELNYDYFDEDNYNAQNIINSCNGLPFCNDKKLVLVKLSAKITKDEENLFISYANNPNPTTCLLITQSDKFISQLPNSEKIDCDSLDNFNLKQLIAFQCKKYNKQISVEASNLLILKCDSDAMKITNEITKLVFFVDEDIINKEDVEEMVANSFNLDIYKLTNALAEKNADETLNILNNLLLAKVEPTVILSAISNSFRRMFLTSISSNQTTEEIAKMLDVKPFAVTKAKENAKKFNVKVLKKINELTMQTDFLIKSGKMSSVNAIHYLIFNILIL